MPYPIKSNHRAVFCLVAVAFFLCFLSTAAWSAVHFTDSDGLNDQLFGNSVSEVEDLNGDGRSELLIGAPGDNTGGAGAGAVYFRFGNANLTVAADRVWTGEPGEKFGYTVARIGDVNDDGRDDWAVGAPWSNSAAAEAGRVYVFYGRSTPAVSADLVIEGFAAGDHFGHALSAAGDFNDDGYDDFIVGAPYSNLTAADAGAAYVIYGDNGDPSTDLADATVLTGAVSGDLFGWSVSDGGNFLGGPEVCVAVGAPWNNTGGLNAGAVYVYEGAQFPSTPNSTPDLTATVGYGTKAGSLYGYAVRNAGRWDGDGYDDLVIGAPNCNAGASEAGRLEIIYGDSSPSTSGDRYVHGEASGDHLGYAVDGVGDVSGSSRDDVVVGAPNHNDGAANSGRAYIYEGGSSSTTDAGNLTILAVDPLVPGTSAGDLYGQALSSAGDFDGDGTPDLAVAAPAGNIIGNALAGYCRVADTSGTLVPALLQSWQAVWDRSRTVALSFQVLLPTDDLTSMALHRQWLSVDGALASEIMIWSGPAGDLLNTPSGNYRYVDELDTSDDPQDLELGYRLTVNTTSGQSINLSFLTGPRLNEEPAGLPQLNGLRMTAAAPNPFNPTTSLRWSAPAGHSVTCEVLDLQGRRVQNLYQGVATGQWQTVTWYGANTVGRQAASGLYLIRLTSEDQIVTRKVLLAK